MQNEAKVTVFLRKSILLYIWLAFHKVGTPCISEPLLESDLFLPVMLERKEAGTGVTYSAYVVVMRLT